ncbi:MAG: PTS glucose transporter subunit IIA [Bacillota bacterium]
MFGFFAKSQVIEFKSPVNGSAAPLASVPDKVFASKMLGDGMAFEPREGIIYAPVSGVIDSVFPTKHAIGIKTKEGLKVIIHIGIDTVNLKGNGFESLVHKDQTVKIGDKLMTFDIKLLNAKAKSLIIPVIITNTDKVRDITFRYGEVNKESTVMRVKLK